MEPFTIISVNPKSAYLRLVLQRSYKNVFILFLTIFGLLLCMAWLLNVTGLVSLAFISSVPPFFFFIPFIAPLALLYTGHKSYETHKKILQEMVYTFTDQQVAVHTRDADWAYEWDKIRKVEKCGQYLLLVLNSRKIDPIELSKLTEEQRLFISACWQGARGQVAKDTIQPVPDENTRRDDSFSLPVAVGLVDYIRMSFAIRRRTKSIKRGLIIMGCMLLLVVLMQFMVPTPHDWDWITQLLVFGMPLLMIFFIFFLGFLVLTTIGYFMSRRLFQGISYQFSHWGIERTGSGTAFSMPWRGVQKVRETPAFFLFFVTPDSAHAIQKKMFRDEEELAAFRAFVNDRMGQ